MNTQYSRVSSSKDVLEKLDNANNILTDLIIPDDIPHGDMPGDKIEIGESHIEKAKTILIFSLSCLFNSIKLSR